MKTKAYWPNWIMILPMIACLLLGCSDTEKETSSDTKGALAVLEMVKSDARILLQWDAGIRSHRLKMVFDAAPNLPDTHAENLVTLLIMALDTPEPALRGHAVYILRELTGENHGFNSFAAGMDRETASGRWKSWWSENKDRFTPHRLPRNQSTLIVDEIPGRIVGNDDEPPGRLVHLDGVGNPVTDIQSLKMPYDAVPTPDGNYLVNIIRARAVWRVTSQGDVLHQIPVGGYPCSLELLENGHLLVAGWDDTVPGFVREFDGGGNIVWRHEPLRWPWKAQRLENGNTLIADAGTNRVFEVNQNGEEVWAADHLGPETPELFDALGPVFCQRLENGNTLVSVRGLSKVVELNRESNVVWEIGPDIVLNQYDAVRLWNGNTLICDSGHFRVIEVDFDKNIVWEKGGFGYPAKAYRF